MQKKPNTAKLYTIGEYEYESNTYKIWTASKDRAPRNFSSTWAIVGSTKSISQLGDVFPFYYSVGRQVTFSFRNYIHRDGTAEIMHAGTLPRGIARYCRS